MQIEMLDPKLLKPFSKNPKKHPGNQIRMLKKSMREFGFTAPVLIDAANMIVAGHARHVAALDLGLTQIPTIRLDLPYEKAVAYVIADNRLAELAEVDSDLLSEILENVTQIEDFDLESIGYNEDDVKSLFETGDNDDGFKDLSDSIIDTYQVVLNCIDQFEQKKIFDELTGLGYNCQILTL